MFLVLVYFKKCMCENTVGRIEKNKPIQQTIVRINNWLHNIMVENKPQITNKPRKIKRLRDQSFYWFL